VGRSRVSERSKINFFGRVFLYYIFGVFMYVFILLKQVFRGFFVEIVRRVRPRIIAWDNTQVAPVNTPWTQTAATTHGSSSTKAPHLPDRGPHPAIAYPGWRISAICMITRPCPLGGHQMGSRLHSAWASSIKTQCHRQSDLLGWPLN